MGHSSKDKFLSLKRKMENTYREEIPYTKSCPSRLQTMQNKERKSLTCCSKKNSINRSGDPQCFLNEKRIEGLKKAKKYTLYQYKAMQAMKRKKVFSVHGQGSHAVRLALLRRGWIEKVPQTRKIGPKLKYNKKVEQSLLSCFLEGYNPNFVWGGKVCRKKKAIDKTEGSPKVKEEDPMRNRLKVVKHWSTKHAISSSLRNSFWYYKANVSDVIAPRTFSNVNKAEKKEFVNDFMLTACTSLLGWVIASLQKNKPIFNEKGTVPIDVIVFAINRCKEFLNMKCNGDIDTSSPKSISPNEWNLFLSKYRLLVSGRAALEMDKERNVPILLNCARYLMRKIAKYRPQLKCEGYRNLWIVKPSCCSRGIGIQISENLERILKIISRSRKRYVVQKYIEKPLLIYNTKFDIRQYYLITSTYPLVIWMYKDCYLKFSSKRYSLNNLHRAIHLTNHAVQKRYKNSSKRHPRLPTNNMWDLNTYKRYLKTKNKRSVWDKIVYPGMKKTITGIMLTNQNCLSRTKNRFGLYGCDFILDNNYQPWLIEINNRPDLGSTTKVTANICPRVVKDIIKVVIDHAKNPRAPTGDFECIYRQSKASLRTRPKNAKTLEIVGSALQPKYELKDNIKTAEICICNCSRKSEPMLNMLRELETIFESDAETENCTKGDDDLDKNKTELDSDEEPDPCYDSRDINSEMEACFMAQIDSDAMTDEDDMTDNDDLTESDAITEPDYNEYDSDISNSSYKEKLSVAKIKDCNYALETVDQIEPITTTEKDIPELINADTQHIDTETCNLLCKEKNNDINPGPEIKVQTESFCIGDLGTTIEPCLFSGLNSLLKDENNTNEVINHKYLENGSANTVYLEPIIILERDAEEKADNEDLHSNIRDYLHRNKSHIINKTKIQDYNEQTKTDCETIVRKESEVTMKQNNKEHKEKHKMTTKTDHKQNYINANTDLETMVQLEPIITKSDSMTKGYNQCLDKSKKSSYMIHENDIDTDTVIQLDPIIMSQLYSGIRSSDIEYTGSEVCLHKEKYSIDEINAEKDSETAKLEQTIMREVALAKADDNNNFDIAKDVDIICNSLNKERHFIISKAYQKSHTEKETILQLNPIIIDDEDFKRNAEMEMEAFMNQNKEILNSFLESGFNYLFGRSPI